MTKALFILLASIALACHARAGWVLDTGYPQGGTVTAGYGSFTTSGSSRSGLAGGIGSGVEGPLTFKWTWTGTDPRPSCVALKVVATASWTGGSGSCDNGMDDPQVLTFPPPPAPQVPTSGISDGTHYVAQEVAGNSFTYSVNPAATTSSGTSYVYAEVTILPVSLSLTGPVGSSQQMAVGQLLSAKVNGLGGANDTFTWSKPNSCYPFGNYQADVNSAIYTPFTLPSTTSDEMTCYFGKGGSAQIKCKYHSSGTPTFDVDLTTTVDVKEPERKPGTHKVGTMRLLTLSRLDYVAGGADPKYFWLWGVTHSEIGFGTNTAGMWHVLKMVDPTFLTPGSGIFGLVQTKDRTATVVGQATEHTTGLDGPFPFPDFLTNTTDWKPADDNAKYHLVDAPGILDLAAVNYPYDLTWRGNYWLYEFYKPADDAAGPSVFVVAHVYPWRAYGSCAGTQLSGPWTKNQDDGSGWQTGATGFLDPATYPIWP
jgi:hypothetical protein